MRDLLKLLLEFDYKKRMTAEQLVKLSLFADIRDEGRTLSPGKKDFCLKIDNEDIKKINE